MEPGSVLSSPEAAEAELSRGQSAEEEERSRMRRKLEHLELELRAAELVTRASLGDHETPGGSERGGPGQHPPVVRKRSSQKREAPRPNRLLSRTNSAETQPEEEENCIMCIRERSESLGPRMKSSSVSEQRLANKRPVSGCQRSVTDLNRIQRSKSDAQDKHGGDHLGVSQPGAVRNNRNTNSISSKLIKRSMSFNRIFNSSMLSKSKEYRL